MKTLAFILLGLILGAAVQDKERTPLSVRELIEVLADFDVKHQPATPGQDWYGITDFEAKKIWITTDIPLANRRKIAIHEALHVILQLRGDQQYSDEDVIHALADREYLRLFGEGQ